MKPLYYVFPLVCINVAMMHVMWLLRMLDTDSYIENHCFMNGIYHDWDKWDMLWLRYYRFDLWYLCYAICIGYDVLLALRLVRVVLYGCLLGSPPIYARVGSFDVWFDEITYSPHYNKNYILRQLCTSKNRREEKNCHKK